MTGYQSNFGQKWPIPEFDSNGQKVMLPSFLPTFTGQSYHSKGCTKIRKNTFRIVFKNKLFYELDILTN